METPACTLCCIISAVTLLSCWQRLNLPCCALPVALAAAADTPYYVLPVCTKVVSGSIRVQLLAMVRGFACCCKCCAVLHTASAFRYTLLGSCLLITRHLHHHYDVWRLICSLYLSAVSGCFWGARNGLLESRTQQLLPRGECPTHTAGAPAAFEWHISNVLLMCVSTTVLVCIVV
jgi:hypothetical protein